MYQDRLLEILFARLEKVDVTRESEESLIHNVTAQYMLELMSQGNIPHFLLDTLEKDLVEELTEIYRKRTYGSLNPHDYATRKQKKAVKATAGKK